MYSAAVHRVVLAVLLVAVIVCCLHLPAQLRGRLVLGRQLPRPPGRGRGFGGRRGHGGGMRAPDPDPPGSSSSSRGLPRCYVVPRYRTGSGGGGRERHGGSSSRRHSPHAVAVAGSGHWQWQQPRRYSCRYARGHRHMQDINMSSYIAFGHKRHIYKQARYIHFCI